MLCSLLRGAIVKTIVIEHFCLPTSSRLQPNLRVIPKTRLSVPPEMEKARLLPKICDMAVGEQFVLSVTLSTAVTRLIRHTKRE